jgi:cyclic pyranopterin phosphate synthase
MCLGQNESVGLRTLLRAGCSDIELEAAIREAIELKPKKHEFIEHPQQIMRFMSLTGG